MRLGDDLFVRRVHVRYVLFPLGPVNTRVHRQRLRVGLETDVVRVRFEVRECVKRPDDRGRRDACGSGGCRVRGGMLHRRHRHCHGLVLGRRFDGGSKTLASSSQILLMAHSRFPDGRRKLIKLMIKSGEASKKEKQDEEVRGSIFSRLGTLLCETTNACKQRKPRKANHHYQHPRPVDSNQL